MVVVVVHADNGCVVKYEEEEDGVVHVDVVVCNAILSWL